jgi:hypothetical protein
MASSKYYTGGEGQVVSTSVRFTSKEIGTLLEIPKGGLSLSQVEELIPNIIKQLFGEGVKRGNDSWNGMKAISVMAGWLPFVS